MFACYLLRCELKYYFTALLLCVLLSGCSTTPVDKASIYYDRAGYAVDVKRDIPEIKGAVLQHGRCSIQITTPGSSRAPNQFCTFALTERSLYVQSWDASVLSYNNMINIRFSELDSVSLATFFRVKQLQLKQKQRWIGFSAMIDDGGYYDSKGTLALFEHAKKVGVAVTDDDGLIEVPTVAPTMIPIFIPR